MPLRIREKPRGGVRWGCCEDGVLWMVIRKFSGDRSMERGRDIQDFLSKGIL
jgi:hypothetical protein